jgi:hypothetical protein
MIEPRTVVLRFRQDSCVSVYVPLVCGLRLIHQKMREKQTRIGQRLQVKLVEYKTILAIYVLNNLYFKDIFNQL